MPAATDPREAVLVANRAFYDAFETLDLDRMAAVWVRDGDISCTHPGWPRLVGWGPVMKSWEDIFANTFGMTFTIADEEVHVHGDVAWVTCVEQIETRSYDGVSTSLVEATNIFAYRDGAWYIAHHHGSPRARRHGDDATRLQ